MGVVPPAIDPIPYRCGSNHRRSVDTGLQQQGGTMNSSQRAIAVASMGLILAACETVDHNPTQSDPSPPAINILIKSVGNPDVEVQEQKLPLQNKSLDLGAVTPPQLKDFSILVTATDAQSGIKDITLFMGRDVCYTSSGGGIANAHFATATRKVATYTDPHNAPVSASVGDTGIVDSRLKMDGSIVDAKSLLVRLDANQVAHMSQGYATKWFAEAHNQDGKIIRSSAILVFGGDTSCNPNP
jgi:hypothetical protein